MLSLPQTIQIDAGETVEVRIPVENGDGTKPNLTGASARWFVGRDTNATGSDVYLRKRTSDDSIELVEVGGVWGLEFTLTGEETAALAPGQHWHEAWIRDADGRPDTVASGPFIVAGTIGSHEAW